MCKETIHCFEKAGLGKAPFRYAGMVAQDIAYGERVLGTVGGVTVTTKPGGSCDYCGTYIVNMFRVESADGKSFKVGCECIRKTGDEGLVRLVNEDVRRMEREKRLAKKLAKEQADKDYCQDVLATKAGTLATIPHPVPSRAMLGETLGHYAKWMFGNRHYTSLAATLRRALAN